MSLSFFDVLRPFGGTANRVHAEADDLTVALREFGLQAGHVTQFGGADRSEILGMRKQDGPAIPHPFVEVDGALRSFCREIGSFIVYTQEASPPRVRGIIHASFRWQQFSGEGICRGCGDGEILAVTREKFLGV